MESKRSFSLNLIFLLALNLLIKPFYLFGIEVGVQNAVGTEQYGIYYAMLNFTFLFNVLLDWGINNFQKVKVAQDEVLGIQNMETLLPMKVLMAVVYMIVTVITALIIGFEERYWFFIGWLMFNHILSVFLLMLRSNLSGLHLFVKDSLVSVSDRFILILGVGYLLLFGETQFQIETFVLFQTGAYIAAICFALILLPKGKRLVKPKFNTSAMLSLARQTWPFALLILLMTAYHKLDGIMLERLAPEGALEAGIYAQAFRILEGGNSFAFLYAGLLLPIFARLLSKPDHLTELRELGDQAAKFLIIPAVFVAIIASFYSEWLMGLLYERHVEASSLCLRWLMGSFVFMAFGYVFGTLVTASANLKWLNWIAFATVILNAVLNVLLIPSYGASGAAFTSFVSLGFMAFAQWIYASYQFRLDNRDWMVRGGATSIAVLFVAFLFNHSEMDREVSFLFVCAISLFFFSAFVINPRALLRFVQRPRRDE